MNTDLIVDAKKELTLHLIDLLRPHIYDGFKSLWVTCKGKTNALWDFQEKLEGIPVWNQDIIDREFQRIMSKKDMDFLDKLLDMIYIGHTKTFNSLNNTNSEKIKITLDLPNSKHFIHRCYITVARELWQKPRLMDDREKTIGFSRYHYTIQQNTETCLDIITKSISKTIRELMPLKSMLEAYSQTLDSTPEEETTLDNIKNDLEEINNGVKESTEDDKESIEGGDNFDEKEDEIENVSDIDDNIDNIMMDKPTDENFSQPFKQEDFSHSFNQEPNLLVGHGKDISETMPLKESSFKESSFKELSNDIDFNRNYNKNEDSYSENDGNYGNDGNDDNDSTEEEVKNILIPSTPKNINDSRPFFDD